MNPGIASRRLPSSIRITALCALFGLTTHAPGSESIQFNQHILPILSDHCFQCHGPDAEQRKANLRLDQREGAVKNRGDDKPVIIPDSPESSLLMDRITSADPDFVMPPPDTGKELTSNQIERLRQWIQEGAPYQRHWAFEPIRASLPTLEKRDEPNPIDRFIIARLETHDLSLSAPASREQLIRRATFDLTGLPPDYADVRAFLADQDPNAFEKVINRLLDSPEYGERWGRHWLDLARYADTHGASAIGFKRFPFSYTYRDYVITAFNNDRPYNRFILEQIAADQLGLEENDPALAGLGFLTVGRQYRNRHDVIDDQIDVITRGLQGLTVACARCHDHKFDPIPTADYYSLHASLSNSRPPPELPLVGSPEISGDYQAELNKRTRLRNDIIREQGEVMRGRLRMQVGQYLTELAKGVPEQDTTTTFLSYRTDELRPVILERWRTHLKAHTGNDPVFGPWHHLARLPEENFQEAAQKLVEQWVSENGDPKSVSTEHLLATKPPKWNPRVLEALKARKPESFVAVAEVYGSVFADVRRRWLSSLLEASIEASPEGTVVPDQDPKHRIVNSSIERQLRHHLYDENSPTSLSFHEKWNQSMLNRGVRDSIGGTLGAIEDLNRGGNAPPRSMALQENPSETRQGFVFVRGNPINRGQAVHPRFLTILSGQGEEPAPFSDGERRLGLAQSIVSPQNPLTRRVIVNWVWTHHFGNGLVRTPDDFGTRGTPPTHPDLLDYLASRFQEDGWSLKALHRRIMLSRAYQQASIENAEARAKDPDNHLLWRMPKRKLEMEAMRDSLLAVSGAFNESTQRGGRPFEEKGTKVVARRTIYAFVNRDVISRMASDFDRANPSSCTLKRPQTMVPQQTLFALNSDYIQNRAAAVTQLASVKNSASNSERITRIYQRVYSRDPKQAEVREALKFIAEAPEEKPAWQQLVHALLASNEFHFID